MLPNFIVIGGTKCGTTSLYEALSRHPGIHLAPKELRFFTTEHRWSNGFDWYKDQFAEAAPDAVCGEFSNAYTRAPVYASPAERIAKHLPDVKLVYMLRDPMRRIASHYRHRLVTGAEWRSPERAVRDDPSYVAVSLFGEQLKLYRQHFSAKQILVMDCADLFASPKDALDKICRFIGVKEEPGLELASDNAAAERGMVPSRLRPLARFPSLRPMLKKVPSMAKAVGADRFMTTADRAEFRLPPNLQHELERRFADDQQLLEELVGNDLIRWSFDQSTRQREAGPCEPVLAQDGGR